MPYQVFRLSLMARQKPPLLEQLTPTGGQSRAEFLTEQFGRRIDFTHFGRSFAYVHTENIALDVSVGRLGRKETEAGTDAPETGFAPLEREGYRAVNLFLNTSSDPQGQKLALQIDRKVGGARPVLESLVAQINTSDPDLPWRIEIHPITDESSFWEAVEEHKTEITNIQLKLVAPNILGFTNSVTQEMKNVRDENNAAVLNVSLDNKDGIKLDTLSIKNAVEYVSAGGGDVILRGGRKKFFDSRFRQSSIAVENDVAAMPGMKEVLTSIMRTIFKR